MAQITLKGNPVQTLGELPSVGSMAPPFNLTQADLSETTLKAFSGRQVVLNIFPSIDTGVCAASVRRFNQEAAAQGETAVLCVSMDLPFALSRFCGAEGLKQVTVLSAFRAPDFGEAYGVTITTGPLRGLLARAVVVVDDGGKVVYTEQVPEITQEPDYAAALADLRG